MLTSRTLTLFCLFALSISALAKDQKQFWTDYIETCNPSAQLNGKAYFISSTNPIGPGSVWGTNGGTANLVADQEVYLGKPDGQGHYPVVTYATSTVSCSGAGSRKWDFTLGAPIDILSAGNVDLTATLNNNRSADVSITAVKVDSIGMAAWSDYIGANLDRNKQVFQQAVDGHHYLMTAAMAISGMTITYTFDDDTALKIKGWFQAGQKVKVGSSDNPIEAGFDISDNGKKATLTILPSNTAYVVAELRPIYKMKKKEIFEIQTDQDKKPVYTSEGKPQYVNSPRVNGGVAAPTSSAP